MANLATQAVSLSLAIISIAQLSIPAMAQSTMLMGSVTSTGAQPQLTPRTPRMDTSVQPVYAPAKAPVYTGSANVKRRPVQRVRTINRVRTVYVHDNRTYWQRHPKVKAATIGAGVGTAAGAATGLITGRGVLRGAAIGAGTGAGVGLVRSSNTMKRHPIVRDVATGSLVGLGLGAAGSRRSKRVWQAAGVGTAVGLGVGLVKHLR